MLTATKSANTERGKTLLPVPVNVATGELVFDAVTVPLAVGDAPAVGTASAATVLSSSGVEVYFIASSPKDTVVNGSSATEDAPGKARRSGGAAGLRVDRSKGPGANTLKRS